MNFEIKSKNSKSNMRFLVSKKWRINIFIILKLIVSYHIKIISYLERQNGKNYINIIF